MFYSDLIDEMNCGEFEKNNLLSNKCTFNKKLKYLYTIILTQTHNKINIMSQKSEFKDKMREKQPLNFTY